eukprot:TRINITY_DN1867_c0_g1_i2.p1 TRINITY_DN1867_c0_g1~~TRINITY_DN1867_c0_g1_i2.p1  ORF type:complete len:887 (+),score=197.31 TRINITY_DN1867_c0_g1_i2:49-2709(+)
MTMMMGSVVTPRWLGLCVALFTCLVMSVVAQNGTPSWEVNELINFYISTNGPTTWDKSIVRGWNSSGVLDPCGYPSGQDVWYGIQCTADNRHIRSIIFNNPSNGLSGSLPRDFTATLTQLTLIQLSSNSISGTLPELAAPNLRVIYISSTNVYGPIPEALLFKVDNSTSTEYSSLDLSYNYLTDPYNRLPSQSPAKWNRLSLSGNFFVSPPAWCDCRILQDARIMAYSVSTAPTSGGPVSVYGFNFPATFEPTSISFLRGTTSLPCSGPFQSTPRDSIGGQAWSCNAPAGTGQYNTRIVFPTTAGGQQDNRQDKGTSFSYEPPHIASCTKPPLNGGTVTITGSSFGTDPSVVEVSISGLGPCTGVTIPTPHQVIVCTVSGLPSSRASDTLSIDIIVDGVVGTSSAFHYSNYLSEAVDSPAKAIGLALGLAGGVAIVLGTLFLLVRYKKITLPRLSKSSRSSPSSSSPSSSSSASSPSSSSSSVHSTSPLMQTPSPLPRAHQPSSRTLPAVSSPPTPPRSPPPSKPLPSPANVYSAAPLPEPPSPAGNVYQVAPVSDSSPAASGDNVYDSTVVEGNYSPFLSRKESETKMDPPLKLDRESSRNNLNSRGSKNKGVIAADELELVREIGQGSSGVVHQGLWRNTNVAVKMLAAGQMTQRDVSHFQDEASLMSTLQANPHVVNFFGICFKPTLCIVVEYLPRGSLSDHLRQTYGSTRGQDLACVVPLDIVKKVLTGIANGMLHLHLEGVIHRDLAARNILLTETFEAKVSDFGMSRINNDADENKTESSVGPLKWMSPESIMHQTFSTKSDVWSFGVTVWEVLTARRPFEGLSPLQACIQVTQQGLRLQVPAGTPPELESLMQDCWATEPAQRPDFKDICSRLNDWVVA